MDVKKLADFKSAAVKTIATLLPLDKKELKEVDGRLFAYLLSLYNEPEVHNVWEILGGVRFLRIFRQYPFNATKVKRILRLYEGEWKDGEYVDGGLLFSGLRGRTHYQLTPIQVFMLAGVYGPHHWVNT